MRGEQICLDQCETTAQLSQMPKTQTENSVNGVTLSIICLLEHSLSPCSDV